MNLFHIYCLVFVLTININHLHGAFVNDFDQVLVGDLPKDQPCLRLAGKERLVRVIRADHDHPEVLRVVVHVHIKDVLFTDAWNANGSPGFPVLHGGIGEYVVQNHRNISLGLTNHAYLRTSLCLSAEDQRREK